MSAARCAWDQPCRPSVPRESPRGIPGAIATSRRSKLGGDDAGGRPGAAEGSPDGFNLGSSGTITIPRPIRRAHGSAEVERPDTVGPQPPRARTCSELHGESRYQPIRASSQPNQTLGAHHRQPPSAPAAGAGAPAMKTFLGAALVALAACGMARGQSVEFRIVERTGQTQATQAGTTSWISPCRPGWSGAAKARPLGGFNFNIVLTGEPDADGTLCAGSSATPTTRMPRRSACSSTVGAGGMAYQYTYLAWISPNFNGVINSSAGGFTNTPGNQEIGLVTGIVSGQQAHRNAGARSHGRGRSGHVVRVWPGNSPNNGDTATVDPAIGRGVLRDRGQLERRVQIPVHGDDVYWATDHAAAHAVSAQIFDHFLFSGFWTATTTAGAGQPGEHLGADGHGGHCRRACCDPGDGAVRARARRGLRLRHVHGGRDVLAQPVRPAAGLVLQPERGVYDHRPVRVANGSMRGRRAGHARRTPAPNHRVRAATTPPPRAARERARRAAQEAPGRSGGHARPISASRRARAATRTEYARRSSSRAALREHLDARRDCARPTSAPSRKVPAATNTSGACSIGAAGTCLAGSTWTFGGTCTPNTCQPSCGAAATSPTAPAPSKPRPTAARVRMTGREGGVCSPNTCAPSGACCDTGGTCARLTQARCTTLRAARWTGGGVCTPNPCPVLGTCCNVVTSSCSIVAQPTCALAGHTWTIGGTCSPNTCAPSGSCCDAAGGCRRLVHSRCTDASATWTVGAVCSPNPCPQLGRCCNVVNSTCAIQYQANCNLGGHSWAAGGTCTPNTCASSGARAAIRMMARATGSRTARCTAISGVWTLGGACSPNPCPHPGRVLQRRNQRLLDPGAAHLRLRRGTRGARGNVLAHPVPGLGSLLRHDRCMSPARPFALHRGGLDPDFRRCVLAEPVPAGRPVLQRGERHVCDTVPERLQSRRPHLGSGGACTPNTCAPPGSCCESGSCRRLTHAPCTAISGVWTLAGVCSPNPCPVPPGGLVVRAPNPDCPADFNDDGEVNTTDVFDFLTAWFAGESIADVNGSGAVNAQDIFDYLNSWYAGCPR